MCCCLFPGVQVILKCFFASLVTLCWKLGILVIHCTTLGTGGPLLTLGLTTVICLFLLFFSDWLSYFCGLYFSCSIIPLILFLTELNLGYTHKHSELAVVLAGLSLRVSSLDNTQLLRSTSCWKIALLFFNSALYTLTVSPLLSGSGDKHTTVSKCKGSRELKT